MLWIRSVLIVDAEGNVITQHLSWGERERERQRERDRGRETDRQTDRQRERETNRPSDRDRQRNRDRDTQRVQFSSRWYLCARKSPYALYHVSQKFPNVAIETVPMFV